jgi:MazG family protein
MAKTSRVSRSDRGKDLRKRPSALGHYRKAMPALARAQRVTEQASRLGFDWPEPEPVWQKVAEELDELEKAFSSGDHNHVRMELGDLFFSLVNLSRFLHIEAEDALRLATDRFIKRFKHIERSLSEKGKNLAESSLEEMDSLWEEAKKREKF